MCRLAFIASLVIVLAGGIAPRADAEQPDIFLILLDDSGWTDFGCYGSRIDTPNIDRLAANGMRFTDCHSAAPNCSPSRAGLLTGRTPSRVGVYSYLPPNHVMHLRSSEITVAELLQEAGYHTGHFGKWHLSRLMSEQAQPADQGFEISFGTDNNASPSHRNPKNFVLDGKPVGEVNGYSCQIVVDRTIEWLKDVRSRDAKPVFTCVWFHEPHTPIASPERLVEKYRQRFPEMSKKDATYYANIDNVDRAVGRLLEHIKQSGKADNTMIFLTSDNGPLNAFSKTGLRGKKSHVWEGGHRVPGIFVWPNQISAGQTCDVPICGVDFLPTVCDAAGVALPEGLQLDGESVLPLLQGRDSKFARSKPLYWFFYRLNPTIAIRDERWALVAHTNDASRPKAHQLLREDMPHIKASVPERYELFDLSDDLAQQENVSEKYPDVFQRLRSSMRQMHTGVITDGPDWDIPENYNLKAKKRVWNSE